MILVKFSLLCLALTLITVLKIKVVIISNVIVAIWYLLTQKIWHKLYCKNAYCQKGRIHFSNQEGHDCLCMESSDNHHFLNCWISLINAKWFVFLHLQTHPHYSWHMHAMHPQKNHKTFEKLPNLQSQSHTMPCRFTVAWPEALHMERIGSVLFHVVCSTAAASHSRDNG